MRILIGENSPFDSVFQVGGHEIARELARRGHEVTFLSAYLSPVNALQFFTTRRPELLRRLRNWMRGGRDWGHGLRSYVPLSALPYVRVPFLDHAFIPALQASLTWPPLIPRLRSRGPFDLFLISNPRLLPLVGRVPACTTILRLPDDVLAFPQMPRSVKDLLGAAMLRCDHVVVTAVTLAEQLRDLFGFDRAVYLPNGVNYGVFSRDCPVEPEELKAIPRPRAIYVGDIHRRFDVGLVEHCAKALPGLSFVVIGPPYTGLASLGYLPNVHILGPRPYARIPDYLAWSQVGIVPFHQNPGIQSVSSLKVLQYLAAGLPTVATRWAELERLAAPIHLASDREDFVHGLRVALAEGPDRSGLRDFARGQDWGPKVDKLLELVG